MQRKAGNRRREPIRYVVEHVYSGKESMEKVLAAVSEEAAKQNVKEKLENQKKGGMRKDADFTGKIKSAVAGGGRNRYNKDSVFLSLDIEETTGGQYADNRNQRNMDSTLCKIIIG